EAENIKKTFLLDVREPTETKEEVIHDAIKGVLERAIMEIKRSLDYYMDSFPQNTIDKAIITGGGACMKNIDVFLANSLGIPVEIIDPLKKISVAEEISGTVNIKYVAPSLGTVIGLALESIQ
ncbi:MAG: pilus assembly protein PilM, partial [Candidatus Omnitrophica bacterium]|nr:pilus assembly protein PilM [Candidatus Omnitrophota bacterium]